jgi:hypothetical protein
MTSMGWCMVVFDDSITAKGLFRLEILVLVVGGENGGVEKRN